MICGVGSVPTPVYPQCLAWVQHSIRAWSSVLAQRSSRSCGTVGVHVSLSPGALGWRAIRVGPGRRDLRRGSLARRLDGQGLIARNAGRFRTARCRRRAGALRRPRKSTRRTQSRPGAHWQCEMREVMLKAFRPAFVEGKALGAMCAYHEIDGIPCRIRLRDGRQPRWRRPRGRAGGVAPVPTAPMGYVALTLLMVILPARRTLFGELQLAAPRLSSDGFGVCWTGSITPERAHHGYLGFVTAGQMRVWIDFGLAS